MNIHRVTIGGTLGKDPELKIFESGSVVCNLSIATNEYYKQEGEEIKKNTTWHKVQIWGKSGEHVNRVLKCGDQIYVEGVNEYYEWADENLNKRSGVRVKATMVDTLRKKSEKLNITNEEIPF